MTPFDRQKYLDLVKTSSVAVALTVLHQDMALMEYQAFEGDRRSESERLIELNAMRDFSREIWEIALQDPKA